LRLLLLNTKSWFQVLSSPLTNEAPQKALYQADQGIAASEKSERKGKSHPMLCKMR